MTLLLPWTCSTHRPVNENQAEGGGHDESRSPPCIDRTPTGRVPKGCFDGAGNWSRCPLPLHFRASRRP